jgi:hypothetical protein
MVTMVSMMVSMPLEACGAPNCEKKANNTTMVPCEMRSTMYTYIFSLIYLFEKLLGANLQFMCVVDLHTFVTA